MDVLSHHAGGVTYMGVGTIEQAHYCIEKCLYVYTRHSPSLAKENSPEVERIVPVAIIAII